MPGKIRLACQYCNTEAFDGIEAIPTDWADVQEIRSYSRSKKSPSITRRGLPWSGTRIWASAPSAKR
jgi:hypothetical protein